MPSERLRYIKKTPKKENRIQPEALLEKVLAKRTKAELIDALVEIAKDDPKIARRLDLKFQIEAPPADVIASTREAIEAATAFDPRDANRNFDYDCEAYSVVERNLR